MRIWRRISATGAVATENRSADPAQSRGSDGKHHLADRRGQRLGGEALALQCARVEGMTDQQIEQLFQAQVDPEFEQIQAEARVLLTT